MIRGSNPAGDIFLLLLEKAELSFSNFFFFIFSFKKHLTPEIQENFFLVQSDEARISIVATNSVGVMLQFYFSATRKNFSSFTVFFFF